MTKGPGEKEYSMGILTRSIATRKLTVHLEIRGGI
jgi:hypothetical protein